MQALIILLSLAWFASTGWAGQRLLTLKRHRPIAAIAAVATITALLTPLICLLVISGVVDYFGNSFHQGSIWLQAAILLATANLASGYACLVYLPEHPTRGMKLMQVCGTACVTPVALAVALIGVGNGFPAASWVHWSLLAGLVAAGLAGIGLALMMRLRKAPIKSPSS